MYWRHAPGTRAARRVDWVLTLLAYDTVYAPTRRVTSVRYLKAQLQRLQTRQTPVFILDRGNVVAVDAVELKARVELLHPPVTEEVPTDAAMMKALTAYYETLLEMKPSQYETLLAQALAIGAPPNVTRVRARALDEYAYIMRVMENTREEIRAARLVQAGCEEARLRPLALDEYLDAKSTTEAQSVEQPAQRPPLGRLSGGQTGVR